MLGNHRDAWVFGALDPSSGTAAMMEISRAFGAMLKAGTLRAGGSWGGTSISFQKYFNETICNDKLNCKCYETLVVLYWHKFVYIYYKMPIT